MRALVLVLALAGCEREARRWDDPPRATFPYARNAWAVAEGDQLFHMMNCVGCHANGGGGMGPALRDREWIYGASPDALYATIVHGRPNGMPAFGHRLADNDVWKLVAYVRTLAGLVDRDVPPARRDDLHAIPPPTLRPREDR